MRIIDQLLQMKYRYVATPGIASRIRKELLSAPATSHELCVILKLPLRTVQVGLWILERSGQACGIGLVPKSGRGRSLKLWDLTAKGRARRKPRADARYVRA